MKRLGEILIDEGKVSCQEVDFCLNVQRNNGHSRLGVLLNHYQFTDEGSIAEALSKQFSWPLHTGDYVPDEEALLRLGRDYCVTRSIYPLKGSKDLSFVLASGEDVQATDFLHQTFGRHLIFYIGIEGKLRKALNKLGSLNASTQDIKDDVVEWFNRLMIDAVDVNASDIHIEPSAKAVEVRLRVKGLLRFYNSLPESHLPKLVNIVFHKSDLTVGDFHHFHDARFTQPLANGRSVDVRVSHVPSKLGSALVLRLLEKDKAAYSLCQLGFSEAHWNIIDSALIKPDGMTLIVGPTGCGKTTTLYAMLNHLKDLTKKIVTIEDPVEMPLPLATQIQIHEERGITFADSIRALLRHDPDIMLIGEIRDTDTAHQSIRAAMTGHKVFATLHTTKAFDAIFRMIDLGIEPFLLGQCLNLVIAQRLIRTLCPYCKRLKPHKKVEHKSFQHKYFEHESEQWFTPGECIHCEKGYASRSVICEIIGIDASMQKLFMQRDWDKLHDLITRSPLYIDFVSDARRMLFQGQTSLDEITRVLG